MASVHGLIGSALFVTWNTVSKLRPNKKPALRGCIGNFTPMPLAKGLREYALIR
jgi:AMMECR1 domain-containing protein